MTWTARLSHQAQKQLARLPQDLQARITRAIDELEVDPFRGDVLALKSKKWEGTFRKRVGRFRIIFRLNKGAGLLEIALIERRTEKTYR